MRTSARAHVSDDKQVPRKTHDARHRYKREAHPEWRWRLGARREKKRTCAWRAIGTRGVA
eukprot:scaffold25502_cov129-Isochrysis_galbana.AAC.1